MNLVKTDINLAVVKYPYNLAELRKDYPNTGFPDNLEGVNLAFFNAAVVVEVAPPDYNHATHDLVELEPLRSGSVWTQRWSVVAVSPSVEQQRFAAIGRKIDADVDAIYAAVQGNRGAEYALAEAEAAAYKNGGYTGTAPSSVQSWATVKNQTATWATDDILTTAALWRGAQSAIRAKRLKCKEDAKSANTVQAAQAEWAGFLVAVKAQLGVA